MICIKLNRKNGHLPLLVANFPAQKVPRELEAFWLAEQIEAEVVRQYFVEREKIRPVEAIHLLGKGKSPNR